MKLIHYCLAAGLVFGSSACFDIQKGKPFQHVAPGAWRGHFELDAAVIQRVPVLFEVESDAAGMPKRFVFKNGQQNQASDSLRFWGDTVYAYFQNPKTYLRLVYEVNLMEGKLYFENEEDFPIAFQAQNGAFPRFPDVRRTPAANINGDWNLEILVENTDSTTTVKINLQQQQNELLGSFDWEGKKHYLAGCIQGEKLFLSGFDGQKLAFVAATVLNDKAMSRGHLVINRQKFVFSAAR